MLQDEEAAAEEAPAEDAPVEDAAPAEAAAAASAAPAAGVVVFPDDYPNSVKHMLLIGSLGMLIGAGVFIFLQMSRSKPTVSHSLCFLACAVSAMAYYAMWTGLGTEYKTTDTTPRVIFLPRYIDWLLTQPLILAALCQINKAEVSVLVSLIGNDILMVLAFMIGAINVAPFKYMWWFAGAIFLVVIIVNLIQRLDGQNDVYKICSYIVMACSCIYALAWVLGSEGTASLGLTQEVAFVVLTDLVAKLGFGLYFLFNYDTAMGEEEGAGDEKDGLNDEDNQQSQQFV